MISKHEATKLFELYFPAMKRGNPYTRVDDFSSNKNFTKLSNAVDEYGGGTMSFDRSKLIAIYDTTFWETGTEGYIFCTDGFYYKRCKDRGYIRYSNVESATYYRANKSKDSDRGMVITLKDGRTRSIEFLALNATAFISYIEEMAALS